MNAKEARLITHPSTATIINTKTGSTNYFYKFYGGIVVTLGLMGFSPSIIKAITTGLIWSVSKDAPHTDNAFLTAHAVFVAVWCIACIIQIWSGGNPSYGQVHKYAGYTGSSSLFIGMVLAAMNEITYNAFGIGPLYTFALILGATANMVLGIVRARQRCFADHKDAMVMAIMFTMDPAIHRLFMWLIRLVALLMGGVEVDADQLLILGKMPANFFLFTVFGVMVVYARRVNAVTVCNISFNLIAYVGGTVFAIVMVTSDQASICTVILALIGIGLVLIIGIALGLVTMERKLRIKEAASSYGVLL
jgi:hypothetical protein